MNGPIGIVYYLAFDPDYKHLFISDNLFNTIFRYDVSDSTMVSFGSLVIPAAIAVDDTYLYSVSGASTYQCIYRTLLSSYAGSTLTISDVYIGSSREYPDTLVKIHVTLFSSLFGRY